MHISNVPRIIPMNGRGFSPEAGTGDNTATGRPRFVIVTDPQSQLFSLDSERQNQRSILIAHEFDAA